MKSCPDLLVPRDLLQRRQPDDHFAGEVKAAADLGLRVHLVDHDAIVNGDVGAGLSGIGQPVADVIYRGWMIPPARYRSMADELQDRGVKLRTSPDAFAGAHHLPNWYGDVAALTAASVWTDGPDLDELCLAAARLGSGPAVLKDYSKSEKHYWDEAMFIPELSDCDRLLAVAGRFLELRADHLDTGFVLRRFEDWKPGEWRSWWVDGSCVAVTAHPDTPDDLPDGLDIESLAPTMSTVGLPFVAVDLAVSASTGDLRIVELGDGQVSDRPSSFDPARFMAAITGL